MRLSHNLASLNIYRQYSKAVSNQSNSISRISSGYKVMTSKDDPSALADSEKMRMQIRGLQMAGNNIQNGISMLQTAEGGMENITSMLQHARELVVEAGDGSKTPEDKATIQNEINQLMKGIDTIASDTEFNGIKMLGDTSVINNNNPKETMMCVGSNAGESLSIPSFNFNLSTADIQKADGTIDNFSNIDVSKDGGVDNALAMIDAATDIVLAARSKYGAIENRLESTTNSVEDIEYKVESAESGIRDVDVAKEMVEYSKNSLLSQAGTAMMVQSNKFPQDILSILQNVRR